MRQNQLTETTTRTGGKEANIVRDLDQRDGNGIQCARCLDEGIMRTHSLELARVRPEGGRCQRADLAAECRVKASRCIKPRANSCASLGQQTEPRQGRFLIGGYRQAGGTRGFGPAWT